MVPPRQSPCLPSHGGSIVVYEALMSGPALDAAKPIEGYWCVRMGFSNGEGVCVCWMRAMRPQHARAAVFRARVWL